MSVCVTRWGKRRENHDYSGRYQSPLKELWWAQISSRPVALDFCVVADGELIEMIGEVISKQRSSSLFTNKDMPSCENAPRLSARDNSRIAEGFFDLSTRFDTSDLSTCSFPSSKQNPELVQRFHVVDDHQ